MKYFLFLLLFLVALPTPAAVYQCLLPDGSVADSEKPCIEGRAVVDKKVYPNNISSRAQAIARAEAIRTKREAATAKKRATDHE